MAHPDPGSTRQDSEAGELVDEWTPEPAPGNKTIKARDRDSGDMVSVAVALLPVDSTVLLNVENAADLLRDDSLSPRKIFAKDSAMVDLPKLIEPRHTIATAKTTQIDMIIGLVANGPNLSGGFCAGSHIVVDHQRINGTTFVFSVAVPALLVVSAYEGINIMRNTPSVFGSRRRILADHPRSAATLSASTSAPAKPTNPATPATPAPRETPWFDIAGKEHLLQDIVDEMLAQSLWITPARRLRGQELVESRPSTQLAVMVALSRKECWPH
ncbi:hypothetical protein EDB86DRAFT_2832032 [Lactarius hatsudake]|nr:hypothetical protein EDB86DRAFT_2832032 [Lactarius hatsudake]